MRHAAFDCGRSELKAIADNYRDYYPSYVGEYRTLKLKNELRPTDIMFKSHFGSFFLGDLAKDESFGQSRLMTPSKININTKALIIAGVARWSNDGEDVVITTGLPVESHTPNVKRDMQELLQGLYTVEINGVTKRFNIRKVNVAVEGASAYMVLCRGEGGTKRFIDVGSRTINFGTIINGRYIDRESGTFNYGCETVNISDADLARRIAADLSRVWDEFSSETHLLGGGTKRVAPYMSNYFPNLLCASDPIFTTAKAFHEIGRAACERVG